MSRRQEHPDLTNDVMRRLGYDRVTGPQPWWKKDRTIIPAILASVGCFVLVMVTLAVIEYRGGSDEGVVSAGTEELSEGIGKAAALANLQEIFFRIQIPDERLDAETMVEFTEESAIPEAIGPSSDSPENVPDLKDRTIDQSIYVPAATFMEVDGYERVVALAPGRST